MLFDRHRKLLALLDILGGNLASLDFQKLLFLYCVECEDRPTYEFVPYRFGGFSLTSHNDKRKLAHQGFLREDAPGWHLTPAGQRVACVSLDIRKRMNDFANRYGELRGDSLVAEVYRRYPFYATRSEIADRVLEGDRLALLAIQAARPTRHTPGLLTIGYEGRSLEGYLNQLLRASVTLLCDVRRNPFSRKFGFSKATLSLGCENVGICYEHLPELGIPSKDRRELHTQADYDRLFANYRSNVLPTRTDALEKIRGWIDAGHRVALTCFEESPLQCHRRCIAEALGERYHGLRLRLRHL